MEKLTRIEQETIISYNREEDFAEVYTHERVLIRKLDKMAKQFPDQIQLVEENEHGGKCYNIPKGLATIRQPFPEERKQMLRAKALGRM